MMQNENQNDNLIISTLLVFFFGCVIIIIVVLSDSQKNEAPKPNQHRLTDLEQKQHSNMQKKGRLLSGIPASRDGNLSRSSGQSCIKSRGNNSAGMAAATRGAVLAIPFTLNPTSLSSILVYSMVKGLIGVAGRLPAISRSRLRV